MQLADWIKQQGRALGFARVGIAPADDFPELHHLTGWLEQDFAGELAYLHNPKRRDVRQVLPQARSVICCALPYDTPLPRSTERPNDSEHGWISRYAWGDDYHTVVEEKLEALRATLAQKAGPGFLAKLYVDTGPVLERVYGKYAGLGWQAKNTCLLDTELGSFFFLGVLVTNLALAPDSPLPDGCGSCTLCLEACPTGAIVEPYVLDARRCISYLTIELRGPIPAEFRAPMGQHLFGCDICQDVCPYNQKAWVTDAAAFQPREFETRKARLPQTAGGQAKLEIREPVPPKRSEESQPNTPPPPAPLLNPVRQTPPSPEACPERSRGAPVSGSPNAPHMERESLFHPRLDWLASLSEEEFQQVFRGSAIKRTKWRGLIRNTLIAMGNSRNPRFRPLLQQFAHSGDHLLAEHARWALEQLAPTGI